MRAQDIIRAVLDLLDKSEEPSGSVEVTTDMPPEEGEPIASRFKQIFAMLNNPSEGEYSNTPNEVVADIEAVTTDAGGGINAPKHPHDIRVAHASMYPNQQEH
jgi:hypothetical protein|tara:strand:+ start:156 stop:464 length:309 start_codon:yes stop_codon:yes gene_type:complete